MWNCLLNLAWFQWIKIQIVFCKIRGLQAKHFYSECEWKIFFPRYSGTDYVNGKIVEGIANSIQECQVKSLFTDKKLKIKLSFRTLASITLNVTSLYISQKIITRPRREKFADCCGTESTMNHLQYYQQIFYSGSAGILNRNSLGIFQDQSFVLEFITHECLLRR